MVFLLLALLFPGTQNVGVVLEPVANVYSAATTDSDVVSQALYGSHTTVLETKDDWLRVRMTDEYAGWMRLASLRVVDEGAPLYATSGRVATVESMFAHVYREPDVTAHAPLLTLPFEARVEVVQEPPARSGGEGRWLEVRLADGRTGWLQRGDITFEPKTLTIKETIAFAKRFLGLPYTWGGSSSYGYDCSGFMQMLERRRGFLLPRDAQPQAEWAAAEKLRRLRRFKRGDLLYFGPSQQKITHTGMYIGRGKFVHATTYERPVIQISRLNDPHWKKLLVAARRIKQATPGATKTAVAARKAA